MLKFQQTEGIMEKYFEVLRSCQLFHDIEDKNITPMLGCLGAKRENYKKGETILAEGDPAVYLGIVLSGSAQIVQVDFYGNRNIVTVIEPSQIFGEAFSCAGLKKLPVDVISSDNTDILLIDAQRITQSCSNACQFHSQMIFNLLKAVSRKNLMFHQKIKITSKRSTRDKLLTYLMLQAKNSGSNHFVIPYDRQELADYLEVERSGLSAEISKLRAEGKIECKKSEFTLY